METAVEWIRRYTDLKGQAGKRPYAFPAYDRFDRDANDPHTLTDGDLLAPALLNAPVSISSFYGLQRVRGRLEAALASTVLEQPLAEIVDDEELSAAVRALYAVLDDPEDRPRGVKATRLSKVLHRKRPQSIVLHDHWVRNCYVGDRDDAPVPRDKGRSWADYMVLITRAIREDIVSQPDAFSDLRASAGDSGLTDVRLLDILAWTSRGKAPAQP